MTKTEELLKLAEEATPFHYDMKGNVLQRMSVPLDPDDLQQLVELVRLQNNALLGLSYWSQPRKKDPMELCGFEGKPGYKSFDDAAKALEAFERFERG